MDDKQEILEAIDILIQAALQKYIPVLLNIQPQANVRCYSMARNIR